MQIRELFAADVTRDIPPVVYFHEQSPAKLQSEVSEYIITGGYPEGDPRAKRYGTTGSSGGIHEQFVHLLQGILRELQKKGGPELPASWISGFYGSGKSSFAKLAGLALDGAILPDGTPLEKALLARDDSAKRQELVSAWQELRARVNPIAVVFDIGGVARDNEHIHAAALRQVQMRLGYCSKSNLVAAKDRTFRKAEFFPPAEDPITARDRIAIGKFFETFLDAKLDREDEAFADAAFKFFPHQREVLRELEKRFDDLPGRQALPERLEKLAKALEDCCRHRPIQKIVVELKRNLDALRDGMEQVQILKGELTDQAVGAVRGAAKIGDYQLAQLVEYAGLAGLEADAEAIQAHFKSETPWRGIHGIDDACKRVAERYIEVRTGILGQQGIEAEKAQARVRVIPGFEVLTADQAHRVLKPILDAQIDTAPDAISPTLVVLRESFASRIGPAEETARDRLDEERNKSTEKKVVKVESNIRGREVQSREQLKAIFRELEERIGPLLDRGDRVRIW